jgi:hypothetical protein
MNSEQDWRQAEIVGACTASRDRIVLALLMWRKSRVANAIWNYFPGFFMDRLGNGSCKEYRWEEANLFEKKKQKTRV